MKFLILHGSFGSPEGNWFPRLKEKLELLNQDVLAPTFPIDDWDQVTKNGKDGPTQNQTLLNWLKVFETQVVPWVKTSKVVIVAHSLGPLFALHALSKYNLNIDAAIFVSPFLSIPQNDDFWQIDIANQSFYQGNLDFSDLKSKIPLSFVLYSDHDPYVPIEKTKEFGHKLDSSFIPVLGAQHLSSEFNQNEFPLVLELCKSRIKLTLYQKYIAHLSEYHPTDIIKEAKNRAIFLPSSELAKEGTFHFQNLETSGFCTLPVNQVEFWNKKQSIYMVEARKAASRVPITRVYIFDALSDLKNESVKQTMISDQDAGLKVFYCLKSDLDIPDNLLDFGIWDESYVCTVLYDQAGVRFNLDSSETRMNEAKLQQQQIMSFSKKFTK